MKTSAGAFGTDGPYYVYVLSTAAIGFHHAPNQRLKQLQRKEGSHLKMVWVSKPFPDRQGAEEHCARLKDKRDYEPPVFLRMCRCEYDQTDEPDVLIPVLQAGENRYTADLATGAWTLDGAAGR